MSQNQHSISAMEYVRVHLDFTAEGDILDSKYAYALAKRCDEAEEALSYAIKIIEGLNKKASSTT